MGTSSFIDAKEPPKKDKDEKEPREIKVRIGIFFDGTNNNRYQVMLGRLARERENKATPKEIQENNEILESMELKQLSWLDQLVLENVKNKAQAKRIVMRRQQQRWMGMPRGPMQSGGFTNIAILERFYKPTDENDYTYKIYVSGPGTSDDLSKGISLAGQASGQGGEGVVKKVWDALDSINLKTKDYNSDDSITGVHYVFDVFGFSRGATEARLFVNVCCSSKKKLSVLREGIKKYNKIFSDNNNSNEDKIQFRKQKDIKFNVGVFDTVASVGINHYSQWVSPALTIPVAMGEHITSNTGKFHYENVENLGLDTVAHDGTVEKVVHICALDEYRENFGLCALPNGGKVKQIFMPGSHSDIGGSLLTGYDGEVSIPIKKVKKEEFEGVIIIISTTWFWIPKVAPQPEIVKMTYENLKQLGWLKTSDEIGEIKEYDENINVKRFSAGIYSNLPLVVMAEQHKDVFEDTEIKGKHAIPNKLPQSFGDMQSRWKGCNSNYGQCYFPDEEGYKFIRRHLIHFSASAGMVNGPHYDDDYCYERILYTGSGKDRLKGC